MISDCDFLWGECVSCMVAHGVTMLGKLHAHGTRYSLIVCIRKSSFTKLTQSRHIAFVPGFWIVEARRRHALYCRHDKHFGFVLKRGGRHVCQGSWRHDNKTIDDSSAITPAPSAAIAKPQPQPAPAQPSAPSPHRAQSERPSKMNAPAKLRHSGEANHVIPGPTPQQNLLGCSR